MRTVEIFSSIQGEGPSTGRPATFLRLGGCNLRCKKCDTGYAFNSHKEYSIPQVLKELEAADLVRNKYLVITGGEPLLQYKELDVLIDSLPADIRVGIETNGTVFHKFGANKGKGSPRKMEYIVSPKFPSMGTDEGISEFKLDWVKHSGDKTTHFKFVIGSSADVTQVVAFVASHKIPNEQVWLMPMGAGRGEYLNNLPNVFNTCIKFGFNLSPRIQVAAFDRKRGI